MMKAMILTLYLISGAHIVMAQSEVTGYVGRSALIRCPYNSRYITYPKYLYRKNCILGSKVIAVQTERGQTKAVNGRFFLHDDTTAGIFTVTIIALTAEDSGQYWCAVKTGLRKKDGYTELKLNVLQAAKVTDVPSTAPEEPSTAPEEPSTAPEVPSTDVIVSCSVAGIAVLMTLTVVLGCFAAKRKKSLEMPDDPALSRRFIAHANTYTDTETTRKEDTPEIDEVYKSLELKQCGAEAEYERTGVLPCRRPPLMEVMDVMGSCPEKVTLSKERKDAENEKGGGNEYESMRDTFSISNASKGAENEYESIRNTFYISKACEVAENEYKTMRLTTGISKASKIAENEYESIRGNLSISKPSTGAENEYESMRGTVSISRPSTVAENEYESMRHTLFISKVDEKDVSRKETLSKARKGSENEYMSMNATLPKAGKCVKSVDTQKNAENE